MAVCMAPSGHQHPFAMLGHPCTAWVPTSPPAAPFRLSGLWLDLGALCSCEAVSDDNNLTALPVLMRGNLNISGDLQT